MTDIPHFALPFRIVAGTAAVNEQDSAEDVHDCVVAIARTPVGTRVELPEFGRPDETFSVGAIAASEITVAVQEWEPRAEAIAEAGQISVADYVAAITVEIEGGTS